MDDFDVVGKQEFLGGLRIAPYFVPCHEWHQGRRILLAMQVEHELKKGEETFFAALQRKKS